MAKKKKQTVSDIIDRIEEDLMTLRDKVEELENHECCEEEDEDDSEEDTDWDEDSDSDSFEEDEE
jgi:hypothetical protein